MNEMFEKNVGNLFHFEHQNFIKYSHIEVRWKFKHLFVTMHRTSKSQTTRYQ